MALQIQSSWCLNHCLPSAQAASSCPTRCPNAPIAGTADPTSPTVVSTSDSTAALSARSEWQTFSNDCNGGDDPSHVVLSNTSNSLLDVKRLFPTVDFHNNAASWNLSLVEQREQWARTLGFTGGISRDFRPCAMSCTWRSRSRRRRSAIRSSCLKKFIHNDLSSSPSPFQLRIGTSKRSNHARLRLLPIRVHPGWDFVQNAVLKLGKKKKEKKRENKMKYLAKKREWRIEDIGIWTQNLRDTKRRRSGKNWNPMRFRCAMSSIFASSWIFSLMNKCKIRPR